MALPCSHTPQSSLPPPCSSTNDRLPSGGLRPARCTARACLRSHWLQRRASTARAGRRSTRRQAGLLLTKAKASALDGCTAACVTEREGGSAQPEAARYRKSLGSNGTTCAEATPSCWHELCLKPGRPYLSSSSLLPPPRRPCMKLSASTKQSLAPQPPRVQLQGKVDQAAAAAARAGKAEA